MFFPKGSKYSNKSEFPIQNPENKPKMQTQENMLNMMNGNIK